MNNLFSKSVSLSVITLLVLSAPAHAYVGPGLGAGALGVILGLVGSIFLALFAVFWYPIKRALFGGSKADAEEEAEDAAALAETEAEAEESRNA
jgi:hypothetical protein